MKVVILAGGRGTRLAEETHAVPKPMVAIGGRPILWHIMRHYASFGFDDFVVACGYKGYVIKEYFANYRVHESDFTVALGDGSRTVLASHREDWRVTLVDTGDATMTGGRLQRLAPMLDEPFLLTYGDGLSDVPVGDLVAFHRRTGALATVTAVHPPPRFGSLETHDGMVTKFREKPVDSHDRINGGFFVMEPAVLELLTGDTCVLEADPLATLASRRQLAAYEHDGFWMPMDTLRDRDELNRLWNDGAAPLGAVGMTIEPTRGALPRPEFWAGRRVLLTGHTGFKGSWLTCWLQQLGAEVMGVSLPEPPSTPSLWEQLALRGVTDVRADIATTNWTAAATSFGPDVVLHLAAQPLVSVGYERPGETFDTNVLGTVRVLEALGALDRVEATVVITTDKVYDPGQAAPHDESHRLGGREPYSASKAAAEIVVAGWPTTAALVGTARAGNVIGGGDWARDRLLPDLVRSWSAGTAVPLRRPRGVRPWQHVLEPLRGYLLYAEALAARRPVAPALNFGPAQQQAVSVAELVRHAAGEWRRLTGDLPDPAWTESADPGFAETGELTLESALAADQLGWVSVLDWQTAVTMTLDWFHGQRSGTSPAALVADQLSTYSAIVEGSL